MKKISLLIFSAFVSFLALAQDGGGGAEIDVNINKDSGGGGFLTNPIVWVIGAAVFILLLVALLRGRRD
jgi:hypothetical protein